MGSVPVPQLQIDDFVDRGAQLSDLWRIARGESQHRICTLQGDKGIGKSYLLKEFHAECRSADVVCALLLSGKLQDVNYFNIILSLWEELKLGRSGEIHNTIRELVIPSYERLDPAGQDPQGRHLLADSRTRNIYGNIITGEVHGDVNYNNYIQVVFEGDPQTRQEVMSAVTRLLKDRLAAFSAGRRVLLLVDSWEAIAVDQQTRSWLMENLLSWVLDGELENMRIILAGTDPPSLARLPYYVRNIEMLPLLDEDITCYWVEKCKLPDAQLPIVIQVTSGIPLALSLTAEKTLFELQNNSGTEITVLQLGAPQETIRNAVRALLEAMPGEPAALLRLCAIPHWFDEGIGSLFLKQIGGDPSSFHDLTGLRFIETDGQGHFQYNDLVRQYILSEWWQWEKRQQYLDACGLLLAQIPNMKKGAAGRRAWNIEKEELYLLLITDEERGFVSFCDHFEKACRSLQYDLAEQYILLLRELKPFLSDMGKLWVEYFDCRLGWLSDADGKKLADGLSALSSKGPLPLLQAAILWSQGMLSVEESHWSQAANHYEDSLNILKDQPSQLYTFLVTCSLGEAYQNLASNSGSLVPELTGHRYGFQDWLFVVQNLPFLGYEWLVHRSTWLPNWHFGTNYQDWIISFLLNEARGWFKRAAAHARGMDDPFWKFEARLAQAAAEQQAGRWARARRSYRSLSQLDLVRDSPYRTALIELGMAEILASEGKTVPAASGLEKVIPILDTYHDHARVGQAELCLSELYQSSGEPERAVQHTRSSIQAFQQAEDDILATLMNCRLDQLLGISRAEETPGTGETEDLQFDHKYLARFPDVLLAWYRRIAVWAALPLTYIFATLLSFVAALTLAIIEGELGLFQKGMSAGTTLRDTAIILAMILLPVPIALWLYRSFYSLFGFLVVHRIGRRLVPIEKEQPRYFRVSESSFHFLDEELKERNVLWPEIGEIGLDHYSFLRRRIDLFSRAILTLEDGRQVIVNSVTSAYDCLMDDIIRTWKAKKDAPKTTGLHFEVLDARWLAFILAACLAILLHLYVLGVITGEYGVEPGTAGTPLPSEPSSQPGINTIVGPLAFHFLPTLVIMFGTLSLWRMLFHGWAVRKKFGIRHSLLSRWLYPIASILSSLLLVLWLLMLYP